MPDPINLSFQESETVNVTFTESDNVVVNFGQSTPSGAVLFTDLTDTPGSLTGEGGKYVRVNVGETGLEFVSGTGSAVAFTDLTDTPGALGTALQGIRVNSGATALEFFTLATVATTGAYSDLTGTPTLATVATTGAYSDLTGTPSIPSDFTGLTDTPGSLTGEGGKYVRVNVGETGLEFVSGTGSAVAFTDLTDTPGALGTALQGIRVNSGATALEFFTLAAVATTGAYSDLTGTPTLAAVATTGAYSDLTGTPSIPSDFTDLTDTPGALGTALQGIRVNSGATALEFFTLAAVATTGAYSDLTGTPSIPSDFTDLTDTPGALGTALQGIRVNSGATALEFFTLAAVATTGAYSDLTGTPSIPSDFTDLTDTPGALGTALQGIRVNSGATALEFFTLAAVATTGAYSDLTGTPSIPSDFTDLTDTPGSLTGEGGKYVRVNVGETGLEFVSGTGSAVAFTDLTDTPGSLGTALQAIRVNSGATALEFFTLAAVATTGAYSDLTGTPTLATVATTGAYSDLTGTPSIPSDFTDLTDTPGALGTALQGIRVNSGATALEFFTLAAVATTGAYSDLTGTPSIPSDFTDLTDTPGALGTALQAIRVNSGATALEFFTLAAVATTGAYSDLTGTPTLATVATTGAYSDLTGTPTLATVATTGAYSDLTGTPTLAAVATTGAYSDLTGTPTLATVATTGAYSDLTGTPSIPSDFTDLSDTPGALGTALQAIRVNSGATALEFFTLAAVATTGAYSDLTGTPTLATVATTGAYSDLTGTPSIPSDFTDLTDTPGSLTGEGGKYVRVNVGETGLEFVTVSSGANAFTDLTDTPGALGTALQAIRVNSGATALEFFTLAAVATTGAYSDLTGTPTLATVATTGAYSDLTGTPSIPSDFTDLSDTPGALGTALQGIRVNSGATALEFFTLATVATTGAYSDLTGTPTLATVATTGAYSDLTGTPSIPSDFTDLTDTPGSLTGEGGKYVRVNVGETGLEFVTVSSGANAFTDLTDTPGSLGTALQAIRVNSGATALEFFTLATVATTGAYSDLTGTPSIPSDFTDLSDTPGALGTALQAIRVNSGATALEFFTLAAVATTGAYSDLTGTPSIPSDFTDLSDTPGALGTALQAIRVNSGATALEFFTLAAVATTGAYSDLTGTPTLATVATTGAYSDLTGTPSIPSDFTDLTDTPGSLTGEGGKYVRVNVGETGLEFVTVSSGANAFTDLTDTPGALGTALQAIRVNSGATALEFFTLAAVATTGAYSDLTGTPTLATVATTGAYSDLTGTPSIPSDFTDLSDTPGALGTALQGIRVNSGATALEFFTLATVATTGAYSDLTGTPTLATVATTGAYSDLTGTPSIPSDFTDLTDTPGSLTGEGGKYVRVNVGETGLEFVTVSSGANAFTDLTDTPGSLGTALQAIRVNSGATALEFFTLATVATTGAYSDLTGTPSIPSDFTDLSDTPGALGTALQAIRVNSGATALEFFTLAAVATTGAYSDLTGTPSIPSDFTDLSDTPGSLGTALQAIRVNSGATALEFFTLATVATTGAYSDLTGTPSIPSDFTDLTDTPGALGTADQIVRVNSGATALEFVEQPLKVEIDTTEKTASLNTTEQTIHTINLTAGELDGALAMEFSFPVEAVNTSGTNVTNANITIEFTNNSSTTDIISISNIRIFSANSLEGSLYIGINKISTSEIAVIFNGHGGASTFNGTQQQNVTKITGLDLSLVSSIQIKATSNVSVSGEWRIPTIIKKTYREI
jgi:hypothetical protein